MLRSAVFSMLLHQSAAFRQSSVEEGAILVDQAMYLITQGKTPQQAVDQVANSLDEDEKSND